MALVQIIVLLLTLTTIVNNINAVSLCQARQRDGSVCPVSKHVKIHFKPYYETFFDKTGSNASFYPDILRKASKRCCNSSILEFIPVNSSSDIEELIQSENCAKTVQNDSSLSFFFPVFVKSGKKMVFDDEFQFVRLSKSPGPVVVMLRSEKQKMKVTPSVAIRNSWPLFVLIVCLSATVGLLGWLLEKLFAPNPTGSSKETSKVKMDHSSNLSQFSSWFYKGAWEGFWWAMVTVTTVGYGDKVPVAFFSRILTILWLFSGAIILSLFTANVTSVLTSNQMDSSRDLIGTRIAVLNSKHYFESNLNVGGTIIEFNSQDEMFSGLKKGDVDRVLFPNYFDIARLEESESEMESFSVVDVFHEPFSTGMALANKKGKDNKAFISCLEKKAKLLHTPPTKTTSILGHQSDTQHRTSMLFDQDILLIIYYNLIAIGVIAGIGVIFDLFRCFRFGRRRLSSKDREETELKTLEREENV